MARSSPPRVARCFAAVRFVAAPPAGAILTEAEIVSRATGDCDPERRASRLRVSFQKNKILPKPVYGVCFAATPFSAARNFLSTSADDTSSPGATRSLYLRRVDLVRRDERRVGSFLEGCAELR